MTFPIKMKGETAIFFAGDYLNKLNGKAVERECKRQIDASCKTIRVNFAETEPVNSIEAFGFF